MTELFYVYRLRCPRSKLIRYIGWSCHPHKRLKQHIYQPSKFLRAWIAELRDCGAQPLLEILTTGAELESATKTERLLLRKFSAANPGQLLNVYDGADSSCFIAHKHRRPGLKPNPQALYFNAK